MWMFELNWIVEVFIDIFNIKALFSLFSVLLFVLIDLPILTLLYSAYTKKDSRPIFKDCVNLHQNE